MKLNENFNQQEFIDWISNFLPDFSKDIRKVDVSKSFQGIKSIQTIGESSLGVRVYIIETEQDPSRRKVSLAKESFTLLRDYGTPNAIIAYHCGDSTFWRLSLLTSTLSWDEGKINKKLSNPKRQSYILGSKAKVKTPHQYLIAKGSVVDIKDLKNRFSLEVVNKEFYKEISRSFINLVGGTLTKGKSKEVVKSQIKLPSVGDHSQTAQEFVVRLIGRVIFCWFLREKKSSAGHSLMPHDLLSLETSKSIGDYYHTILEPIFFEVLNKKINSRKDVYKDKPFADIPYLNGGLFAPHDDDHYSNNDGRQAINHNLVVIPDTWFVSFFEILETYNFTIDENTSFDEELSIDPEMLGRIFENLLAEINPETGESARKSTGSYYTPRVIVDYMVDESLYLYLKDKTSITENKLRSVISYDLDDDSVNPLTDEERDKITQALQTVKILDPACGSGAFPIGALQKIVFILQRIDPHGQIWFKNQIQNTSIELKRLIQKEFEEKNFDYLRKLGVIRENIYGVDIQPIATEISRLRCFLTLVVDQRVDDTLPNRGIEPLPNLDFKFVTANTLIGLPKFSESNGKGQVSLIDSRESIDKLKDIITTYFNADIDEKKDLKFEFANLQKRIYKDLEREYGWSGIAKADLTRKLTDWEPFSHKATDWFDPEWMYGISDGFDVIISNPPWGANLSKEEKLKLKDLYTSIDSSTPNSFAYFLGLANKLGNNVISYVLPDSFLIKDFAKTRRLFAPTITEISWYQNTGMPEDLRPFVYVEHDVCVIFATNSPTPLLKRILQKYDLKIKTIVNSLDLVEKGKIILKDFEFVYNLTITSDDLDILNKINVHEPISSQMQCHEGIHTGNIRGKLFHQGKINSSCHPLFYGAGTGGDIINNYSSTYNGWYVDYRKEIVLTTQGEYASLRDERIFINPKIYITRTGNPFKAFLDLNTFASNNFFSLQYKNYDKNSLTELKIVLPFIISRLTQYFIRKFAAPRLGNTFVETKIIHLLKMKIPELQNETKNRLINLVDQAIKYTKEGKNVELSTLQREIDKFIYKLYGLNSDEISLIEST